MSLGSLWGIGIRLNPLFLLFALLWITSGSSIELVLVTLLVVIHEFAHGLAGRALGLQVDSIELYPFGGVARIDERMELEPFAERRLAWAGPAVNLALAGLGLAFYSRIFPGSELALFFIHANLVLATFNMLPALPLDGGRILRSYLTPLLGFRKATEFSASMGQIFACLLFILGIAGWLDGRLGISVMLVAVFLFFAAAREKRQAVYAFLRSLGAKERNMAIKGGLKGEFLVVADKTPLLAVFRLFSPQRYHFIRVMDCYQRCRGEITETSLIRAAIQKGLDIPIKKVL